jgi:hypothetical protein
LRPDVTEKTVLHSEFILPNGTEVQEQLFGNLEQLHQTTMFISGG